MRVYFFKLRSLAALLFLTFALLLVIIVIAVRRGSSSQVFAPLVFSEPRVIIDAGHGGLDGGASSASGIIEAPLNLAISVRTRDFLVFLGIPSIMTRENEDSLGFSDDNTIRQNKTADLKERLEISRVNPNCDFLSIHLNKYEQTKYSGAQVFFSPNNDRSAVLAAALQEKLRVCLDPSNTRRAKLSPESVFLMKTIVSPAVTIECGFLSNPREAQLLAGGAYQTKIALAICCGYIDYLEMSDV